MSPGTFTTIIALISLLVAGAAAVGGSFRLARNNQATSVYRDNAQAWQKKSQLQDQQIADLQAADAVKETEIAALRGKVQTLEEIVTSRTLIEKLGEDMRTRSGEVLEQIGSVRGEIRATSATLLQLSETLKGGSG